MRNGEYVTRGSGNSSVRFLHIRREKQACIRNYNSSLYPAKTPLENSWRQLSLSGKHRFYRPPFSAAYQLPITHCPLPFPNPFSAEPAHNFYARNLAYRKNGGSRVKKTVQKLRALILLCNLPKLFLYRQQAQKKCLCIRQ